MKFNLLIEQLLESLDNPYPYQHSERDGGFIFFPDPNNQKVLYTVLLLEDPDYVQRLEIMFHYTDEDKDIQGTADMTGTGDAFRVMATVVKIVQDYLNNHDPNKYEIIRFSAKSSDHGKVTLYKRLGRMLKDKLGRKWDFDIFRDKQQAVYELSKMH
jgi:hypothetical protein